MKYRKSADANFRVPEGLTETFREKLSQWHPTRKVEYLLEQAFSKYVSDDTAPAAIRRARAIEKWLYTESMNEATNHRLLTVSEEYNILPRITWAEFRSKCQMFIASIIGEVPPVEALIGSFSGGASTSRPRTSSHPSGKYLGKAHVTKRAMDLFYDNVIEEVPGWLLTADLSFEEVRGNVMFTVPKKTDIDRVACKEPDINMFIQKGIGDFFRNRLRRVGINLNDQSNNRKLARIGSIDQSLATLDLSSASDSISSVLVMELLPEAWHTVLDAVRCHVTIIDGEEHVNEMFSSMGNGFTFELESLLFYAIAKTVNYCRGYRGIVSVYGDDIIVPTGSYQDLVWTLEFLGFSVNPDKSFSEGSFRESCGGHYDDGCDITPFYVKSPIVRLTDVMHLANSLRAWGDRHELGIIDPQVYETWLWLASFVPKRFWGGRDTSFKFTLVTPDAPRDRLQPLDNRRKTGLGGYFHWLNATQARQESSDGVQTSLRSDNVTGAEAPPCRVRSCSDRAVPPLSSLFLEELG